MEKQKITVVDAPEVSLLVEEKPGDILLQFYKALGWNGEDRLNPRKVRTTTDVFKSLNDVMCETWPDPLSLGMMMVNFAPSGDDTVPAGKVHLLDGWITPDEPNHAEENPYKGREVGRYFHCKNCCATFQEDEIIRKGEDEYCPSCMSPDFIEDEPWCCNDCPKEDCGESPTNCKSPCPACPQENSCYNENTDKRHECQAFIKFQEENECERKCTFEGLVECQL